MAVEEYSCLDCRDSDSFPLDQIKKLDTKYFEPVWGPRQWSLLEHANRTLVCFWKAKDQQVLSFIFGEVNVVDKSFEIFKVVTVPEARRQRLASELFHSLCEYCSDQGIEKILLQVASNNLPAIKTYNLWGFGRLREMKNYYGDGQDAIELMFQLGAP